MKCIACGTDNNLKDRTDNNGRCANCSHRFVFEPNNMTLPVRFTDPFFAKAIADLSAENALYFTRRQLYYFLNRRLKRKDATSTVGCLVGFIVLLVITTVFFGGALAEPSTTLALATVPMMALTALAFLINIIAFRQRTAFNRQRRAIATALQIIGVINLMLGGVVNLVYLSPLLGFWGTMVWFVVSVILGIAAIVLGYVQKSRLMFMPERPLFEMRLLRDWLARWETANGTPPTLLNPPTAQLPPASINPDITAYSFDRALVTSSAAIAQMLIANNLHLEHNCAILSITGYPQNIFSTVMEMLRRNPNLTVYALHDATPTGMTLLYALQTDPKWFRDQQVQFVDLGIVPQQIFEQSNFAIYNSAQCAKDSKNLPTTVRQALSTDELRWLDAGNYVELEAFGPQKLLQVIRMGMSASAISGGSDGSPWGANDGAAALALTTFG
jgi:DNA-directed RNA polymerase subunit RPC12/RpoP